MTAGGALLDFPATLTPPSLFPWLSIVLLSVARVVALVALGV